MKTTSPASGFHHISIFSLAEHALGCSREENTRKLIRWLNQIADATPDIISIETLIGDSSDESAGNIFLRVIYSDPQGLERVRSTAEHQKMMEWFNQICLNQRMDVNTLIE